MTVLAGHMYKVDTGRVVIVLDSTYLHIVDGKS